jgi:MerR family redox-sensitive transcriptional activator SoxR
VNHHQLTVTEIARCAGIAVSHVRYYERAGLLPPPSRLGRQRRYPASVLERLRTIAEAREAGLSLEEIRELSELGSTWMKISTPAAAEHARKR